MTSGFSDRHVPLINGSLHGVRSFEYNKLGVLTPVVMKGTMYAPGVNVAKCAIQTGYAIQAGSRLGSMYPFHPKTPDKGCTCGFYAYFEEAYNTGNASHTYMPFGDRILGVVEGSGHCLVGEYGFRAEKLKILALVLPSLPSDSRRTFKEKFQNFAAGVDSFVSMKTSPVHVAIAALTSWMMYIWSIIFVDYVPDFLTPVFFAMFMCLMATLMLSSYGMHISMMRSLRNQREVPPEIIRMVRENYPDVAYFKTMKEARKEFPLSTAASLPAPQKEE